MYDLTTASSDCDYTVVFANDVEAMLQLKPPPLNMESKANFEFGADKHGIVEYSAKELGPFVVELAKGNPKVIELLYSEKPPLVANWAWEELRAMRCRLLTLRCARQYLGFAQDRLVKVVRACDAAEKSGGFDEKCGKDVSKLLYHLLHKTFDLRRILRGDTPHVALRGEERDHVLGIRNAPPASLEEARRAQCEADTAVRDAKLALDAAAAAGTLPAEANVEGLAAWLRAVRARCAARSAMSASAAESDVEEAAERL
eukprot:NODE_1925_length_1033_cov_240.523517.p1 GENE.NODE_1925_length_1033_cov_240.523517~~NODE_1925_length_1033_cov_240.523517.p1  ORF type:complete len:258 (+),score=101.23 NODE_1925_length_1033_cov_240.523517:68-841(+)